MQTVVKVRDTGIILIMNADDEDRQVIASGDTIQVFPVANDRVMITLYMNRKIVAQHKPHADTEMVIRGRDAEHHTAVYEQTSELHIRN